MAKIPINNFDKFIKEKVETHQTRVDTDRLWSNIQRKGLNRKTGILPGALLLILVSLLIGVHLMNERNSIENSANLNDSRGLTSAMNIENVAQQTSNTKLSFPKEASSEKTEGKSIPVKQQVLQIVNNGGTKNNATKKPLQKNLQLSIQAPSAQEAPGNIEIVSAESVNELLTKSDQLAESFVSPDIDSENLSAEHIEFSKEEVENASVSSELGSLTNLDIAALHTEAYLPEMPLLARHASRIQQAKYKKGLGIRISGGAGKVIRNMELLNPEADQWMQSRMNKEHPLESFRWGIDCKLSISKNVYFFAGIEDLRINERFDYVSIEQRTYVKEDELFRLVYDEDSYTVERGPISIYEEIHKNGTFYNQFRMINIPFGLGVTQQFGRFGLGLEGAILVNAFNQIDGKIADAANVLLDMKDAGMKVSQIQTARINGVFTYQLSPGWGLNLITGADLPLKSVQLGQHMSQKYMVFQGNLGICYNW